MIIDIHTHTPYKKLPVQQHVNLANRPDKPVNWYRTWEQYQEDLATVDRAVVFDIACDPRPGAVHDSPRPRLPAAEINDRTAEFVAENPEKFIGFMAIHPFEPDLETEVDRAVNQLGLRGMKVGPNYQNFNPLGPEAFRLYAMAQERSLPILFHQGTSPNRFADLDYAHPRHMDRVAMTFPDLKVIMAHMGHPWQIDCIAVIRKHPNVYADISALFYRPWSWYECMRLATEWGVLSKLLFGSDYGVATPAETMEGCRKVNEPAQRAGLPLVPEEEIEALIHRDSLALLGLDC